MKRSVPLLLLAMMIAIGVWPGGIAASEPTPNIPATGDFTTHRPPAPQVKWQRLDTVNFALLFPEEEAAGVVIFGERAEKIRQHVVKEIGQDFKIKIKVYLAPDRESYRALLGGSRRSEWSIGSALAGKDTIVMFSPRGSYREKVQADAAQVFAHELAHIALFNVLRRKDVPRWLTEGLAQMVAREWNKSDSVRLTIAVLSDNLIPLADLADHWPSDKTQAKLAYAESLSLVLFLRDNLYLTPLLVAMRDGTDWLTALRKVTEMDFDTFLGQWHDYLKRKHTWILLFDEGCLWVFMALLLVAGYFVVKLQRRRQYARLDDPERGRRKGRHYDDIDDLIDDSKWGDGWY